MKENVQCGCCGKEIAIVFPQSTYIGNYGLDLRPEYEYQLREVYECPFCHYCSTQIHIKISENIKRIVFSEKYQEIMERKIDQKDRRIKAAAKLADTIHEKIELYLTSCWYLEFQNRMPEADAMRRKAVSFMEKEIEGCPSIELIITYLDSLRQLGEFQKCREVIYEIDSLVEQEIDSNENIYKIFQLEKKLCREKEKRNYFISEV